MAIVKSDLNDWPRFWLRPFFEEEEWGEATDSLSAYETDDAFVVKANVPGVPAEKVDISVEGGVVTVKAEHEETKEEKSKRKVVYREGRTA
ncbi:Hsp20/alpha crystallin family protein, partial [Candidatus Shapirobacteria bacterium]|nr:Hsp20/alpha crystallin family protein [Candidatus Shapirobacteria bacterium]